MRKIICSSAVALSCHQCNGPQDAGCTHHVDKSNKYLKPCSAEIQNPVCAIYYDSALDVVVRGCEHGNGDPCESKPDQFTCKFCKDDGCNSLKPEDMTGGSANKLPGGHLAPEGCKFFKNDGLWSFTS